MLLKKINILLAHNDPMVMNSVADIIEENRFMQLVGTACSGLDLLEKSYLYHPDVIISDLYLNTLSGVVGADFIYKYFPSIKLIAYTNLNDTYVLSSLIIKGYKGIIMPSLEEYETIQAIYSVTLGGEFYSDNFEVMVDWFSSLGMISHD